jgi:ComF family protein
MFNPVGALLDLLFPPTCSICNELLDAHHSVVCPPCEQSFETVEQPYCHRCGQPIDKTCPDCRKRPSPLLKIRSAFVFGGRIQEALSKFKYKGRWELATYLADQMLQFTPSDFHWDVDLLIPVPLHRRKLWQRGYNQSALLAKSLSRKTNVPCSPAGLVRIRATPSQSTRSNRLERLVNLKGAFKLGKPKGVAQKNVCLVDDVITTGATLTACAEALLKSGVRTVQAVTVARTVLDSP